MKLQSFSMLVAGLFGAGIVFAVPEAQEEGIHGIRIGEASYEQLSTLRMQERLVATAEQFKEIGPLERASHYDIAYPANSEEYDAMEGSGILWVTSHSQIQEELPLTNMRISIDGIGNLTTGTIFVVATIEEDELVSSVLGKYRSDAVYLVPFFKEVAGATLVADYSMNRTDFVLGHFDTNFPAELGPLKSIHDGFKYPSRAVFLSMLRREYPIAINETTGLLSAPFEVSDANYQSDWDRAHIAWKVGDYPTAVSLWRHLAERGYPEAQYVLGVAYVEGKGVRHDLKMGVSWFLKAANQGHLNSMSNVGSAYWNGRGVTQSFSEAVFWWRKAAHLGEPQSQSNLAYVYLTGKTGILEKDHDKALYWLARAALKGHEKSLAYLSSIETLGRSPEEIVRQASEYSTPAQTVPATQ